MSTTLTAAPLDKQSNRHQIGQHCIIITGRVLKTAQLRQELYYEIDQPDRFIEQVRASGLSVDVLTFLHQFPHEGPLHPYKMEWDNYAAIPIKTYDDWLKRLPKQTRRGLRKAAEAGVEVRLTDLSDDFVRGVGEIFNESPLRQGKRFWHYGKNFDQVKEALLMDIDRARFLGAYCQGELIGFIKLLRGRNFERTSLILSKFAHRSKYPNNAMVAKALETCIESNVPFLVYGQIDYGKVGNKSLADFKFNNGFTMQAVPRYYVPLSTKGKLALQLGLHHGPLALVPKPVVQAALKMRAALTARKAAAGSETAGES